MHKLLELARRSVEEFIRTGREFRVPEEFASELSVRSGVFVCIKKKGNLRGCIGTFMPCTENIALETVRNAISAATRDPRFTPVTEDELDQLEFSVDVLSSPEKVSGTGELDPKEYGIIVVKDDRKGLLLPDLEGVDSAEEQLRIARMKACISPDEEVEIFRFKVSRYR